MTPAGALFWEFRGRLQSAFTIFAICLAAFAAIKFFVLGPAYPVKDGTAAFVFVPTTFVAFYIVGMFTHGLSGDLSGRHSIYPARFFTLPVSNSMLAFWPMLYASVSAVVLWLVFATYMRAVGAPLALPLIWPALMLAAYFAWMQALMWMPYGLRGLRVVAAVLWLFIFDAIVVSGFAIHVSQVVMAGIAIVQLPLAFLAARFAIARARCGDVPDWRRNFTVPSLTRSSSASAPAPFPSPSRAQAWFEWRLRGLALPSNVAALLPFLLWLLFIPGRDPAAIVIDVLVLVMVVPSFLAFFSASTVSAPSPFTVTKPLTTAELIRAKLIAMFWSAIVAWAVVLVMVPSALVLAGRWAPVGDFLQRVAASIGAPRAVAIPVLMLAASIASTWRQLVQSMCIGLSGNPKLIKASVLLGLMLLAIFFPAVSWVRMHAEFQHAAFNALPLIVAFVIAVRFVAAVWIAWRLLDARVLSDRALIGGALCWALTVMMLYALLTWLAASPVFPRYFVGATAILAVPLVRISAAPLALTASRHR